MLVVVLLIFSGCSTFRSEKQIEVITEKSVKLNLDAVELLDLKDTKWIVLREKMLKKFL